VNNVIEPGNLIYKDRPSSLKLLLIMVLISLPLLGFFNGVFQVLLLLAVALYPVRKDGIVFQKSFIVFCCMTALYFLANNLVNSSDSAQVKSLVADDVNRIELSIGYYSSSGDINWIYALRYIVYVYVFITASAMLSYLKFEEYRRFIKGCLLYCVFIQILLVLVAQNESGVYLLKWGIGQSGQQGYSNYLSTDAFGLRHSLGFYEPSQMSLVIGSIAAVMASLDRSFKNIIFTVGVVLFFFFLSRSLSVFAGFILFSLIIRLTMPALLVIMLISIIVIFTFGVNLEVAVVREFDAANLLRSIGERFLVPEFFQYKISHFLFGIDFGRVYTTIPIINQVMIFGALYSVIFAVCILRSFRSVLGWLAAFFIVPQPWFLPSWIALIFLQSMLVRSK
jgi:hypothetical protein